MSVLAHSMRAARGLEPRRRDLDKEIQSEIVEAKRIQKEIGCGWAESLRLAARMPALSD